MTQIERANPFSSTSRSILDRFPFIGTRREQKRVEQGEDPLSLMVMAKLMSDLETSGFTATYIAERICLETGNPPVGGEGTTQKQRVILKGKEGKSFRVKLESNQGKEDSRINHNSLSLFVQDHVKEGPQRFIEFYKNQFSLNSRGKPEEQTGKEFYGRHAKNWRYDGWFNLEEDVSPVFLREVLDSTVDVEATREDYERFEQEQKAQNTPRSTVMTSVLWNSRSEKLLS